MSNLTAATVSNVWWIEDGLRCRYTNGSDYGVRNEAGEFLSFDGIRPSKWGSKGTAAEIAATIVDDGSLTWVPVEQT